MNLRNWQLQEISNRDAADGACVYAGVLTKTASTASLNMHFNTGKASDALIRLSLGTTASEA